MNSINNVTLSGRLVADAAINEAKTRANFTIAHNFSKDKRVFVNFTYFAKAGKRTREIPEALLKKGKAVKVDAYFYPDDKNPFRFIVKNVEPLTEEEAAAAEGEAIDIELDAEKDEK